MSGSKFCRGAYCVVACNHDNPHPINPEPYRLRQAAVSFQDVNKHLAVQEGAGDFTGVSLVA